MGRAPTADVEVRYISAESDVVTTSVAEVDGDRVVRGRPARAIPSYARQRHYPGWFWSATTGDHVRYESRLELDKLWLADFDANVRWIAAQPMHLSGRDGDDVRSHVPDFLLAGVGGVFTVVDVKPAKFVQVPKVAAVFEWTGRLCASRGWRYEVWSGASAVVLENVRTIGSCRRPSLIGEKAVDRVLSVFGPGMSIDELSVAATGDRTAGRPAILSQLWTHRLETDLDQPLSGASVLTEGTVRV